MFKKKEKKKENENMLLSYLVIMQPDKLNVLVTV